MSFDGPLWDRFLAIIAEARRIGGEEGAERRMQEFRDEAARYDGLLREASDAVLAEAPADMPPIRDRNMSVGTGLMSSGVCYVFKTDAGLAEAQARKLTDWLDGATREAFLARGYPQEFMQGFGVSFTTHEVILREAGGDYHLYFH